MCVKFPRVLEKSLIPLVNLVLQSWMLAGCLPTSEEAKGMCDTLSGIDQRYLVGEKQIPRVRALVAIKVSQFSLLGLCGDPSPSTQLLAECADLLYQNQLYPALERFSVLVSFPRFLFGLFLSSLLLGSPTYSPRVICLYTFLVFGRCYCYNGLGESARSPWSQSKC